MNIRGVNFVCFNCRSSVRRTVQQINREVLCTSCKKKCIQMGNVQKIPPKNKVKEWDKLEKYIRRLCPELFEE